MTNDLTRSEVMGLLCEARDQWEARAKKAEAALSSLNREVLEAIEPFVREYRSFDCVTVEGVPMLPDDHRLGTVGEWPDQHMPMEAEYTFGDLRRIDALSLRLSREVADG